MQLRTRVLYARCRKRRRSARSAGCGRSSVTVTLRASIASIGFDRRGRAQPWRWKVEAPRPPSILPSPQEGIGRGSKEGSFGGSIEGAAARKIELLSHRSNGDRRAIEGAMEGHWNSSPSWLGASGAGPSTRSERRLDGGPSVSMWIRFASRRRCIPRAKSALPMPPALSSLAKIAGA
jgi:hypothetical protein